MNYYEYGMKMVWNRMFDIFRRSVSSSPQSLRFIGGYPHSTPSEFIAKNIRPSLITLVSQILSLKEANSAADTSALEREIDVLVYGLYGLTEEEIGIIEKR